MAAGSHDIGKVSPTFAAKIFSACGIDYKTIPALAGINPELEKQWGGHAGVSQATAEELGVPKFVAEILGQHHGFSPPVDDKRGNAALFGGAQWFDERQKLVAALKAHFQTDWPTFDSAAQARVVAGLTSVADWIGSGEFFENPDDEWQPTLTTALNNAGFITPDIRKGLSFAEVFDPDQRTMQPREPQSLFIEQVTGPGVYILEAQMGMGKTEAALFAAYQLLAQEKATGIYFALPTQLTSNKIYDRFNAFLKQITHAESPKQSLLLHSGAWLLDTELGEEGRPGGSWFNQNKRGLLAPFAVGTIDQALMAVMNVKHGFVRAFGLAGKVVILDEVHSYDLYTGTLLNELVAFLRQIDCTVIILSATLSQTRREALLQQTTHSAAYPLITAAPVLTGSSELVEVSVPVQDSQPVELHFCRQDERALEEALERAAQGQQVLWIENTVAEAQQRYLDIASRAAQIGCETGLLHSRFTPDDRGKHEDRWVALYGRAGWSQRAERGRILIGTQVLEQSLDMRMEVRAYARADANGQPSLREPALCDFHMVGSGYDDSDPWQNLLIPKTADGKKAVGGGAKMTYRYYLQDAAFAVVLALPQQQAESLADALQKPVWDLYLGRKNCAPTELIYQGLFTDKEAAWLQAQRLAEDKHRLLSYAVIEGEGDGEVLTLNDVPVQFGQQKRYRDRQVTLLEYY